MLSSILKLAVADADGSPLSSKHVDGMKRCASLDGIDLSAPPPPPLKRRTVPSKEGAGDALVFGRLIESGANGRVFEATYGGVKMAVKISRVTPETDREVMATRRLRDSGSHPNVVQCLREPEVHYGFNWQGDGNAGSGSGSGTGNTVVMQFFELCSSDAFCLAATSRSIGEVNAKVLMQQILLGIQHCHFNGIIHRDIKPDNILILGSNVKLTDFGSCFVVVPSSSSTSTLTLSSSTSAYDPKALCSPVELNGDGTPMSTSSVTPMSLISPTPDESPTLALSPAPITGARLVPAMLCKTETYNEDRQTKAEAEDEDEDGTAPTHFDASPRLYNPRSFMNIGNSFTELYAAPEVLLRGGAAMTDAHRSELHKCDSFSAAITLYAILFGYTPWRKASEDDELYEDWRDAYASNNRWKLKDILTAEGRFVLSPDLLDFMIAMLDPSPATRLSIEGALQHSWIALKQKTAAGHTRTARRGVA